MFDFEVDVCDDAIMVTHARIYFDIVHQVHICHKYLVQYIVHSSSFMLNLVQLILHSQI